MLMIHWILFQLQIFTSSWKIRWLDSALLLQVSIRQTGIDSQGRSWSHLFSRMNIVSWIYRVRSHTNIYVILLDSANPSNSGASSTFWLWLRCNTNPKLTTDWAFSRVHKINLRVKCVVRWRPIAYIWLLICCHRCFYGLRFCNTRISWDS